MSKINFTSAQHVDIEFEIAPVVLRIAAYVIDTIILSVYLFIVFMAVQFDDFFTNFGTWLFFMLLLAKLPWILYQPVMEYLTGGQTIGKMALGIRVVRLNGERVGWREVITRWLLRGDFLWISASYFVFLIPFWNIFDSLIVMLSSRQQRIGDSLAGTIVIKNKSSQYYKLNDVLKIKTHENYTPTYLNVVQFTDEDMIYIKNCIQHRKRYKGKEIDALLINLAQETALLLGVSEIPTDRVKFLETVLNDYVVLTR
ncbi:MAG: RDD family protein [Bacteroidota bacterium]